MADSKKQTAAELRRRKKQMIALLETPFFRAKAEDALRPKGIPFIIERQLSQNYLVLHVVNEYFLYVPLSQENVDRALGLVPYFLHRPDLAREEIPGIQRIRNWGLARKWDALTTPPID